jgi:phospholipase/carboxylesterase
MEGFIHLHEPGAPTLVMLHGTGGDEVEMMEFGHRLTKRHGLLSIRGKEPEGTSNRWFRRLSEGVFDEENLKMRANELADFVEETLPGVKRYAVGFSNGANMAAACLLLRPDAFDGAALLAPMVPLAPSELPSLDGKLILMVCGENDPLVPRSNALALATIFQTAGANLEVHWHPGGHGLGPVEMNVLGAWVARLPS